eukprot:gnl/TRDRNA2_/TRDRNA2_160426_c0_seq1.p1 gnl/TRDRNA2_/TRDRNA2_160426_c0~~gnl/TRDRNA2_/TRDRNA2_160426_c0_seq1.p1  ORF type:complete len:335 (-),score=40.46 gnl/TRDRNA2_/TRDRNA2_160426_c0_seq1:35-1039(-)
MATFDFLGLPGPYYDQKMLCIAFFVLMSQALRLVLAAWFIACMVALPVLYLRKRLSCCTPWASSTSLLVDEGSPSRRAVLVVAHPDDEAMFFWPTLLQLQRERVPTSVLCLSTGDADGLGTFRSAEMSRSCRRLGIEGDDLRILDMEEFQDGMEEVWCHDAISTQVLDFVRDREANLVITFDGTGVSGHPNHIATCHGVCRANAIVRAANKRVLLRGEGSHAAGEVNNPPPFQLLLLDSVSMRCKYLGPLGAWLASGWGSACTCVDPTACLQALFAHRTQLVWYRLLFAMFSVYAYVNTYAEKGDWRPALLGVANQEKGSEGSAAQRRNAKKDR